MKNIKFKSFLISIIFLINSCGYNAIYSSTNKYGFNIEKIELTGDDSIARNIKNNLNKVDNESNERSIKIFGEITYEKSSQTKDLAGNTTQYRLITKSEFKIITSKEEINFIIKENFDMKNFDDEFEEKKYEDTIKENFARSISNKLLLQISRLK
tara:strand:+ start:26 stop:490 length:465 start_codon:yes stop_codon:yes gene_type:complete